jgi:hypothetical protein
MENSRLFKWYQSIPEADAEKIFRDIYAELPESKLHIAYEEIEFLRIENHLLLCYSMGIGNRSLLYFGDSESNYEFSYKRSKQSTGGVSKFIDLDKSILITKMRKYKIKNI